jgi:hypothetical protein
MSIYLYYISKKIKLTKFYSYHIKIQIRSELYVRGMLFCLFSATDLSVHFFSTIGYLYYANKFC